MRCVAFSLRWSSSLQGTDSRLMGLSSCGAQAQSLCNTWNPSGTPRMEPVSPASAGGVPSTVPPGESPAPFLTVLLPFLERERLFSHCVSAPSSQCQTQCVPTDHTQEMGSLVSLLILLLCLLLSHHSPTVVTAILKGTLLNPDFRVSPACAPPPSFISQVGPTHSYSLRLIFSSC